MKKILKTLASLELTLGCLAMSMVLIFFGTLDQTRLGIHGATEKYFYTVFVYQYVDSLGIRVPYMPGGYMVGFVFLLNLLSAIVTRFRFSVKKLGIWMVHVGLIVLLLGEFISSVFQEEARMIITEGESSDYTESIRHFELALIDTTAEETNRVYAIPEAMLKRGQQVRVNELPFYVSIDEYMSNSVIQRISPNTPDTARPATRGLGLEAFAIQIAETGKMDESNHPSVIATLFEKKSGPGNQAPKVLGTWLVSDVMPPQDFTYQDRDYTLKLRPQREIIDYNITLKDFSHDRYLGTSIPKNFSSEVTVSDKRTATEQDFLIYMNNPLRYDDLTFYQSGFLEGDQTTILQVVRNPARHLPYISTAVITLGLAWQFTLGLIQFSKRRKKAAA